VSRRRPDRIAAVLRVRTIQEDVAAAARQRAELDAAHAAAVAGERRTDLHRSWSDRAVLELAFGAVGRADAAAAESEAFAEGRRAAHAAAVQRARGIERLVERRGAEAARDDARRAAATLDDLASARHRRGRG